MNLLTFHAHQHLMARLQSSVLWTWWGPLGPDAFTGVDRTGFFVRNDQGELLRPQGVLPEAWGSIQDPSWLAWCTLCARLADRAAEAAEAAVWQHMESVNADGEETVYQPAEGRTLEDQVQDWMAAQGVAQATVTEGLGRRLGRTLPGLHLSAGIEVFDGRLMGLPPPGDPRWGPGRPRLYWAPARMAPFDVGGGAGLGFTGQGLTVSTSILPRMASTVRLPVFRVLLD